MANKKVLYVVLAVVLIGGLATAAYFMFGRDKKPTQAEIDEANKQAQLQAAYLASLQRTGASQAEISKAQKNLDTAKGVVDILGSLVDTYNKANNG
jgi:uncharacterized membrane protein